MTPKEYQIIKSHCDQMIKIIEDQKEKALNEALKSSVPKKLRLARPKDIKVGAIIWYQSDDLDTGADFFWEIVEEVLKPNDSWKAYCAEDGCRYGLQDAFVEDV